MLSTRKLLLSIAAAVILIGGYAYADQVVDEPVVHQVQLESGKRPAKSPSAIPH